MKKSYFLLIFGNLFLGCALLHAQVLNGSFTTGDYTDWSQEGTLSAPVSLTSTSGAVQFGPTNFAVISSTDAGSEGAPDPSNSATADDIQNALGVTLPSTNLNTAAPTDGQAIYQQITLTTSAALTFIYTSSSDDGAAYDAVGYSITNAGSFSVSDPLPGTFYQLSNSIGYTQVTTQVLDPGIYILGFTAYNTSDNLEPTTVEVSDISEAPEPATWLLAACGLVVVALATRRIRRA